MRMWRNDIEQVGHASARPWRCAYSNEQVSPQSGQQASQMKNSLMPSLERTTAPTREAVRGIQ